MSGDLRVRPSAVSGKVALPGSKSHTIRAFVFAALARGESVIRNPLMAGDTSSCRKALEMMGISFQENPGAVLHISGRGGKFRDPGKEIGVGNSGTALRILTAAAALGGHFVAFDGDDSIRSRPMQPLLSALYDLGAEVCSSDGHAPLSVKGPLKGGKTMVDGITSQYLTALLITAPLLPEDTEIEVIDPLEIPYINMTLSWLDRLQIRYRNRDYKHFLIPGSQSYPHFDITIPGDFSTAAFPLTAAAVTGGDVTLTGLDPDDIQGDKRVLDIFREMGMSVLREKQGIIAEGRPLRGISVDLNDIPDALPALAVAGCAAEGETRLLNVPQARLKESDRIRAMVVELKKMGADIRELEDGLVIRKSRLSGAVVEGYGDHRVVMALAMAGLTASGETIIKNGAAAAGITYPSFVPDFQKLGADIRIG